MISNSKFIKCPSVLIIAKSSEKTVLSTTFIPPQSYPLKDIKDVILLLRDRKANISTQANGLTVL